MRVTTGKFKGRTLHTVKDFTVRPATDRVRQTIFNVLTHRMQLDGCRVLDLFAGSGSLGIEALSRGAAHATFVEQDGNAVGCLEANLERLGAETDATVLHMDALHFLRQSRESYDLIFADPPYAYATTAELPEEIFSRSLLTGNGFLLIEHAAPLHFAPSAAWTTGPVKQFGRTVVTFFKRNALP